MTRGFAERGRWCGVAAVLAAVVVLLAVGGAVRGGSHGREAVGFGEGAAPGAAPGGAPGGTPGAGAEEEGVVRVGSLTYAGGRSGVCFADDFLATVARESDIAVQRHFDEVPLAGEGLFDYPFVVMTGEGAFTLSEAEKRNLKAYLEGGGFVLASAGCSNPEWSASFRGVIEELFGEQALAALDLDHPLFHTIYDIDRIDARKSSAGPAALYGLARHDSLRVVFSPLGLNDTGNAGEGCCCCGGNEVRNARLINANILAYALTH